jgi:hypothetical protein
VDHSVYHVVLEGAQVGPYDRRTIVGMRIKKTLTSDHVLIGADGAQLTVRDLMRRKPRTPFNADATGSHSVIQGAYAGYLVQVSGRGIQLPRFKGEIEVRVQADGVLRLAGRFRRGFGWKEGRVKIALDDVAHVQVNGSQVALGLRGKAQPGQFTLDLFTPELAGEFVDRLPDATPFPTPTAVAPGKGARSAGASRHAIWTAAISVVSVAIVVGVVLGVVLHRAGR